MIKRDERKIWQRFRPQIERHKYRNRQENTFKGVCGMPKASKENREDILVKSFLVSPSDALVTNKSQNACKYNKNVI